MSRGALIALEGIDGAGKGALVRRVGAALRARGHDVLETAQPSTGPVGLLIREALAHRSGVAREAMGALFAADRADHVARVILPALTADKLVLCDRYELSNLVYRGAETLRSTGLVAQHPLRAPSPGACRCRAGGDVSLIMHDVDCPARVPPDPNELMPIFMCTACAWKADEHPFGPVPAAVFSDWECPECLRPTAFVPRQIGQRMAWAASLLSPVAPAPDLTLVLDIHPAVGAERRVARGAAEELYDASITQRRVRSLYRMAAGVLAPPIVTTKQHVVLLDGMAPLDTVEAASMQVIASMLRKKDEDREDG